MLTFKPKDWIAALALICFTILRLNGVADGIDVAIAVILGYYFVKRKNGSDNGH